MTKAVKINDYVGFCGFFAIGGAKKPNNCKFSVIGY